MDPTEESNRKTALERDRVRSQVGTPLAPQMARNPEEQEKPGGPEGAQEETEATQREPQARQQEAAKKQEATAGAVEEAAKKIPGAGAVVSGLEKNFPILWLIISVKTKINAQAVFLQLIVKVLLYVLGPLLWPILVFVSHFTPKLLPQTTNAERFLVLLTFILILLMIAAVTLLFLCFTLGGLITRTIFTTGVTCGV